MALQVEFEIAQDLKEGKYLLFSDSTGAYNATSNPGGYGSPNTALSAIIKTRIIFGDYFSMKSPSTGLAAALPYIEYTGVGNPIVDNKRILALNNDPDIFITGGASSGGTLNQTGRTQYSGTFLPGNTPLYLLPSQVEQIQLASATQFADTIMQCQYEVYGGSVITSGNIVQNVQYIVTGTGTVTYNNGFTPGGVYRVGEVFVGQIGVATFTTSGSPVVYQLQSSVLNYFALTYNSVNMQKLARAHVIDNVSAATDQATQLVNEMQADIEFIQNMYLDSTSIAGIDIPLCMSLFTKIANTYNAVVGLR